MKAQNESKLFRLFDCKNEIFGFGLFNMVDNFFPEEVHKNMAVIYKIIAF
jgi:hypothetical protein